jgi:hypothetical protein
VLYCAAEGGKQLAVESNIENIEKETFKADDNDKHKTMLKDEELM